MKDHKKTKGQLVEELAGMQRRIAELERSGPDRTEVLKASEERFRNFIDNAVEGIYRTTPGGRIVGANMAFARMFGYESPEAVVNGITDIAREAYVDPHDRRKVVGLLTEKGYLDSFECRMHRKDGTVFWVAMNARSATLEDGTPCFEGFVVDITKRKQAEEALRESERKLREAQEIAHVGHWIWNVRTGEVEWSEEVFKIFQLDPDSFTPHIDSILDLSPWPEENERDKELIRKTIESHEKGTYEHRFLRPDKSIGYYFSSFQGKYDDEGNLVFIVGTVQDITERKQAENALVKSERRFKTMAEASPLAIYMSSGIEQRAKYLNPAFERLFGYTIDEIPSISEWWPLAYPDGAYRGQIVEEWQKRVEHAIRTNSESEPLEAIVTCKDGTKKTISWGFISSGRENWAFGLDLTKRKEAEEEREKLIVELKEALSRVRTLSGLLPICASCKKIRNDKGYWEQMEKYIRDRSEVEFSHGICPECAQKLYPGLQQKK